MQRDYEKKLLPAEMNWLILNNLSKFNDKPLMIDNIYKKIKKLPTHPIVGMFVDYYEEAYNNYYKKHGSFPDMAWFQANFKSKPLKILEDDFSMSIYEDLNKQLDYEILRQELAENIVDKADIDTQYVLKVASKLTKFAERNVKKPKMKKEDILNMYDNYAKDYKGIKTCIPLLDDVIGMLGYKSLCTLVAPSGHGKSTFAITTAYNVAVYSGLCVDYLSFEVPKDHIWFNLSSMESNILGIDIPSTKYKEAELTEGERELARKCTASILDKLDKSGGFIDVHGIEDLEVETFEGLLAKLETIAEERGRKADLIIVDNVDNLQILKSEERNEMTRVNNYIIEFDSFCKRYHNNDGTTVLFLSQTNRPALKKLQKTEENDNDDKHSIDVSVIQKFNALYEKSTVCLCLYASKENIVDGRAKVTPIKLRNRPLPLEPIELSIDYTYSRFLADPPKDTSLIQTEAIVQTLQDSAIDVDAINEEFANEIR